MDMGETEKPSNRSGEGVRIPPVLRRGVYRLSLSNILLKGFYDSHGTIRNREPRNLSHPSQCAWLSQTTEDGAPRLGIPSCRWQLPRLLLIQPRRALHSRLILFGNRVKQLLILVDLSKPPPLHGVRSWIDHILLYSSPDQIIGLLEFWIIHDVSLIPSMFPSPQRLSIPNER